MGVKLGNANNALIPVAVSEINVTPLVDVMLVLLIVFMVAAPLMASGINVDLPKANAKPLTDTKPPITVSVDAQGKRYIDKNAVGDQSLVAALRAATGGDVTRRIHVKGDRAIAYGTVVETMGEISDAGFAKVALVSEPSKH
ncbi:Biopolymer transport protein ExbD [Andreprevotia sp. IGB-42]|uniref:ExbD/TolR family protein n=1 Tax=Andreprevotia sp. IGB-42 TaxID=2497473 RepID=UPI00135BE0C1|nr:biopolymer transporter ExbD [Andreprevotia sp. IGB-42]KAF0812647.1 Biopolymer transport protein ExbD [Andreprevotia sp. IGB-42]